MSQCCSNVSRDAHQSELNTSPHAYPCHVLVCARSGQPFKPERWVSAHRDGEAELLKLEADLKTAMQMFISHKEFISDTISHTASAVRQIKGQVVRNPTQ